MALLLEQQETNAAVQAGTQTAQTFVIPSTGTITSIKLKFRTYSGYTSDYSTLTIKIQDGFSPWTTISEVVVVEGSGLVGDYPTFNIIEFTFITPVPVTGSIKYRVEIYMHDTNTPPSAGFCQSAATNTNPYGGGNAFDNNLNSVPANDLWFEIYGTISGGIPTKATNPTPTDSATSVDFSALGLSWDDGGGADTFDVYMGPSGNLSLVSSAQAGTTFTVDTADVPWGETIYWRIDSTNGSGTTMGDVWSFETVVIRSVKLGANGAFIVVAAENGVYLSTDSGANWTKKLPDGVGTTDWAKGICSNDGTYIIVVSDADAIYRSANSGTSWGAITPAGGDTFSINKMATSDDGQFMVIVGQNSTDPTESCYISADYGVTWTAKKPVAASITWTDCDISNDGTIIAVSRSSYFYISFDSGTDWTEQGMASTAEVWEGLSISGDGAVGFVANTNDNDEFFIGTYTELFSEATWAETSITSAGRALLDDADAAAQATTLGLGTGDSPTFAGLTIINSINEFSTDGTMGGDSDSTVPTEKATKLYVDTLRSDLASVANGKGASLVGIEDAMSLYIATDVEAALEEIMDAITVVTTTANSITTVTGTLDSGNVASTQTINDADTYDVSEVTGAPGFDIQAIMTGIETGHEPNLIEGHYSYDGNHTIRIEMWNYTGTPAWDLISDTVIENTAGAFHFFSVAISGTITDYCSGGEAKVRFNHAVAGNITHDFSIDYLATKDDHGIGTGITDHGSMSGLDEDDHHLYHNDARAAIWLASLYETAYGALFIET